MSEPKRQLLEELDAIENALVERIAKSDSHLPHDLRFNKAQVYSDRENCVRRFETSHLIDKYNKLRKNFEEIISIEKDYKTELMECNTLSDTKPAEDYRTKYGLLKGKGLKRFTSMETLQVVEKIKTIPPQEYYGKFLYLEPVYSEMSIESRPETYRDFLEHLTDFVPKNKELNKYLIEFYDRYFSIGQDLRAAEVAPMDIGDNPLYCSACARDFTNANVYKAHFSGKKHQRAVKENKNVNNSKIADPSKILLLLTPILQATIANLDRKANLTDEERRIEVERTYNEREIEDEANSDDEAPKRQEFRVKMLKGPQGTPIPRWLHKLHGLSKTFSCEICGFDVQYAGRKAFERHFTSKDACHANGLRQLGIQPSPVYIGISTIKEALDLKSALETKHPETEREVEDDEGNVMGERMYMDLKKQGLI